jgi:hypothetical protein
MRFITRKHGDLLDDLPKLGPAITQRVPPPEQIPGPPVKLDVEDDQNVNSKYVLSGRQREIVKTQEAIERSDQNDNILRKRDQLPDRVQHLIDDVTLFYDSPYFSTEQWEQGLVNRKEERSDWAPVNKKLRNSDFTWDDIDSDDIPVGSEMGTDDETEIDYYETPFDSPGELWDDLIDIEQRSQYIRDDVFVLGDSVSSDEAQLGYELGSVLKMLRPSDENDPVGIDLIWGFILAFIGQSRLDMQKERDLLNEVINEMSDRHDGRMEDAALIPDLEEITEQQTEGYRMTAEMVEKEGIEPHPIVVEEVLYHQTASEDNEKRYKENAKKTLSQIEDVVPLRLVNDLYSRLAADIRTIQEETTQEIDSVRSIIEGFEATPTNEDDSIKDRFSVGSKLTGDIVDSVGVRRPAVTHVLNKLSGDEDSERWTTTPVVVEKAQRGEWGLTAYGTLLLYIFQHHQGDPSAVFRFAVGPEEISLQDRKLILEVLDEQGDIKESTE